MSRQRGKDREHWNRIAGEWIAWARAPGHDAFWSYRNRLAEFIGNGAGQALDVGCGEGRIARVLRSCGYDVTACDPVAELVRAAEDAESAHRYAICDACDLPFPDESFDLVVAYNVLMDVEDVAGAVSDMRRVLRPSGELIISIVHPFADIGNFADATPEAPFVITENYFGRKPFEGVETRDGHQMSFFGWSQPLQNYVNALQESGLAITSLQEPAPEIASDDDRMKPWTRMPLFLWLKARPLPR